MKLSTKDFFIGSFDMLLTNFQSKFCVSAEVFLRLSNLVHFT